MYNVDNLNLDSLEYIVRNGDTLIQYAFKDDPNRIRVPFDYRDSTFLNYYIPIAFRLHKDTKDSLKESHKYWRNDIKIFFGKHISKNLKKEFLSFAKKLDNTIDSLKIYPVKSLEASNYVIYTSEDYEYEPQMTNNKNSGYYVYWKKSNKIYKGAIKLNDEKQFNDRLKLYELKRHFVQSLGYFRYDDRLDCKHFFSNCYSPEKQLTALDLEILKYHYSYGICKGITLESFQEFHRQAAKIKAQGDQLLITHLKSELEKDN
jgi:hypothetical protein